jgi:hypothetical protein
MLAYVGHSSPTQMDWVEYRGQVHYLGSREAFARMRVADGAPFFVSLSCNAGAFDMPDGDRSIAEEAVMNPDGPIASFAASRVSHVYPNMLYGEALIDELLGKRPATLGDGMLAVKRAMLARSSFLGELLSRMDTAALKEEHEALYNLLGDPATRLRFPARAEIALPPVAEGHPAGGSISIGVRSASVSNGSVTLSVETRRRVIRASIASPTELAEMPLEEALAAMTSNHERALDKTVLVVRGAMAGGRASLNVELPREPGDYVVKALVVPDGGGDVAVGNVAIRVR